MRNTDQHPGRWWTIASVGFAAVGVAIAVTAIWLFSSATDYGDFVGGVAGSLWSFAALLAIIGGLNIQRAEIHRNEENARIDRFESHFFQLLSLHNALLNDVQAGKTESHDSHSHTVHGRAAIESILAQFKRLLRDVASEANYANVSPKELITETYGRLPERSQVGHYFRNLYHIFRYVDDEKLPNEEAKRYTSLIRAQLSSAELGLLFYNVVAEKAYLKDEPNKFTPLIVAYSTLENMDEAVLANPSHRHGLIDEQAWQAPSRVSHQPK